MTKSPTNDKVAKTVTLKRKIPLNRPKTTLRGDKITLQDKILEFFNGDEAKAYLWFNTKNPGIGNITPNEMIRMGRGHKLEQFIDNCLEENRP